MDESSTSPIRDDTSDSPLVWVGPLAFVRQDGHPPGLDHDFGDHWGQNQDQRMTLRHPPDSRTGLLYAYDPTWDLYAVLAPSLSLAAAHSAHVQALETDRHLPVEDFARLVAEHDLRTTAQPPKQIGPPELIGSIGPIGPRL